MAKWCDARKFSLELITINHLYFLYVCCVVESAEDNENERMSNEYCDLDYDDDDDAYK